MVILSGFVVAAAALFVLAPLLGWGASAAFDSPESRKADRREELLRRRQEILAGIKDLDLEYEVGKLTREDHEAARERLSAEAVEIYRHLDEDARE
jgi:hypothetical protein